MVLQVGYKPHQLKYGASEYVDHVIVLPEGQPMGAVDDDYSDQNSDIFVEMKNNLKHNKSPPSIISNRNADTMLSNHHNSHNNGGDKNYFLGEDSPVREINNINLTPATTCYYRPTKYDNKPIPLNSRPTPFEKSATFNSLKQTQNKRKPTTCEDKSPIKNDSRVITTFSEKSMPWDNKTTTISDNKSTPCLKSTTTYDNKHLTYNNRPIFLNDEQPVKDHTQEKQENNKNKDELKNYFVLDSVSNNNENGTFNWYINDESKTKEKKVKITTPNKDDDSSETHTSLKHTIKFYEQDKQKKRKTRSVGHISLDKSPTHRAKEDKSVCDRGVDSSSCVQLQHSPVRQSTHCILPNKSNLKRTEKNNKLHITVKENKSPRKGALRSPPLHPRPEQVRSPVSPSKTGNCRSVLCVKSDPQRAVRGPNGEINFFHPFENEKESEDEEEQLSIYDVKKLKLYNSGLLGKTNNGILSTGIYGNYDNSSLLNRNSKSWDRGLNSRQDSHSSYEQSSACTKSTNDLSSRTKTESRQLSRVPTTECVDNDLSKSACDLLTLEKSNENNPRRTNIFGSLSASAYDLSREQPTSHYYNFVDSNDFYFNSRDNDTVTPFFEQYRRQDSSDSSASQREGHYDVTNPSNLNDDYHYYGNYHNKRYGSLDCLYPSNYRSTYRGASRINSADARRRLFAGYSYLSLGALPPDHEIIRSPSRESRARELELELNFIRNERRKMREERGFDFYYDQAAERKKSRKKAKTQEKYDSR